jgi:hypothetical protein
MIPDLRVTLEGGSARNAYLVKFSDAGVGAMAI